MTARARLSRPRLRRAAGRRGAVYVLAMLFLAIFASMAVAYASSSGLNLIKADNQAQILRARMAAESGMEHMTYVLEHVSVSGNSGQALLDEMATKISDRLDGTSSLAGQCVAYDGTTIEVPPIAYGDSQGRFQASVHLEGTNTLVLAVVGSAGAVSRTVSLNFRLIAGHNGVFDYGIATKSSVKLTGNAAVRGQNSSSEASIFSGTFTETVAFDITGNACIQGDIHAANPDAEVDLTGNISIGGVSKNDPRIDDHIHVGVDTDEFPEVDPAVFEPFATNIVDAHTSTSGNKTFTNIRIRAGTNPTFAGNVTLKGVIYIEQPNQVHFTGNTSITGVIVTEDAGEDNYDINTIRFTGNLTARGVEELPDTSEFHDLKNLPGSFILAPGFGLRFTGNFGTVGGCMAADSFAFTGNAGGTVHGGIINYSDSQFSLTGNSQITIDRDGTPTDPAGFHSTALFRAVPATYAEPVEAP